MQGRILEEWRIQSIERKADEAVQLRHEVYSIKSDVGSLEYTVRELSSLCNGLRSEIEALQDKVNYLESRSETEN